MKKSTAGYKNLLRKFKMTREQWDKQMKAQNNGCAICRRDFNEYNAYLDHAHSCCAPGKKKKEYCGRCNRGILCYLCNRKVVGAIENWIKWEINPFDALAYLIRYGVTYAPKEEKAKKVR